MDSLRVYPYTDVMLFGFQVRMIQRKSTAVNNVFGISHKISLCFGILLLNYKDIEIDVDIDIDTTWKWTLMWGVFVSISQ